MKAFSLLLIGIAASALTFTQALAQDISISIDTPPPALVVDEQPACPQDGYIWTPGYWAYDQNAEEYYWVDGAWVQPPEVGLLWTPSYWGWSGNDYVYYPGYWGNTVGFYGGVNYGHGYWGNGYGGGRWNGNQFSYNLAANNVARDRIHNTYSDRSMFRSASSRRVSYNGGRGGTTVQPTAEQRQVRQQARTQLTPQQQSQFQAAAQTRSHAVKAKSARPVAGTTTAPRQEVASPSSLTGEPQAQRHDATPAVNSPVKERTPAASSYPTASQPNERRAAESPATRESSLTGESPATHQAPLTHEAPATHQAPVTHEATPMREAPATHQAPLTHEATPMREAPMTHQAPATHAAPATHEAPVSHAAPVPAVHSEAKAPAAAPAEHAQGQPAAQPQDKR